MQSEIVFFEKIKPVCKVIFDVGASNDTIFLNEEKEVHYFEPLEDLMNSLKSQGNKNTKSIFNQFGLSDIEEELDYYKNYHSFYDRKYKGFSDIIKLPLKRADKYIVDNKVENIDFLKIDVEGFELNVLRGLGDYITKVKYIQFEYGSTYGERQIKLKEVIDLLTHNKFTQFCIQTDNGLVDLVSSDDFSYNGPANIVCRNIELASSY